MEQSRPVSDAQRAFRGRLVDAGHLLPSAVPGVVGQGPQFLRVRDAVDAAVDRLVAAEAPVRMAFPPVEPQRSMESIDYLRSFPQLVGALSAFDGGESEAAAVADLAHAHEDWSGHLVPAGLVMVPAACHPVYPAVAALGPVAADGVTVDAGAAWVFRHEPSDDPCRMQAFHQREVVRLDVAERVGAWRDAWRQRVLDLTTSLGLDAHLDEANDPFFGRAGRVLARSQRAQALKFELLVPVGGDEPTAVASFNAHGDHFAATFGITGTGGPVHTACLGVGLERVTLALLWCHGLEVDAWPATVRGELAL